ncbi:hypothetical protein GOP47_0005628 [Adiantum capillus-veneris]|uniref:Uncharacterized protein n=1 Tax=Adiantum capillus-veneris TaxID=13818 RepID=A0A9D4V5X0_ADICA|nr:hypothetical protein GOP47_0005628 [Adiantum capillus-veneris]
MNTNLEAALRRCVEDLQLKDGSVRNGVVAEEKKSPRHGVSQGKQVQGRISKKQRHRRSSKGAVKILPADEGNFKAVVFEHTCYMPSPLADCAAVMEPTSSPLADCAAVMETTSPLSLESNSSVWTWGSLPEAAGSSMSQPASPKTPTSLPSNMGFLSQPTSPLSHSRPTSFSLSPSHEAPLDAVFVNRSAQACPQLRSSDNLQHAASHSNFSSSCNFSSTPYPNDLQGDDNQAGWPQGAFPSVFADLEGRA